MTRIYSDEEADSLLKELYTKYQKGIGAIAAATWVAGAIGALGIGGTAWQYIRTRNIRADVEETEERIKEVLSKLESKASATLVPPGTVCAWPGVLPPSTDAWWENWRECDGGTNDSERKLQPVKYSGHERLWDVLKGLYGNATTSIEGPDDVIELPDFRDRFLRGMGSKSAAIGEPQGWATALPVNSNLKDGPDNKVAFVDFKDILSVASVKETTYQCRLEIRTGTWDNETRPQNCAIHWVIRIK